MTRFLHHLPAVSDNAPLHRTAAALSDPIRLRALRRSGLLDPSADAVFDRYTRLATRLLGTPVALLSLVEPERQTFKSRVGMDVRHTPLSHSFCQHVVERNAPLVVEDAREHPLVRANAAIADLGVVAYVGAPVHAPEGEPLGSFCVVSDMPRAWTEEDVHVIEELAASVSTEIGLRMRERRASALTDAATLCTLAADDTGAVFDVSPSWTRVTGRTTAQSTANGWTDVLHIDDRTRIAEAWQAAVERRSACTLDCRLLNAKGETRSVRLHGAPVWADTGTFTEYVGAFTTVE